ncbi:MAG: hypothetical protein DMG71_04200, partial [Acidobacteria bacterium]
MIRGDNNQAVAARVPLQLVKLPSSADEFAWFPRCSVHNPEVVPLVVAIHQPRVFFVFFLLFFIL